MARWWFSRMSRSANRRDEALKLASSVYQSSNDAVVVTDENNLILDVNPAFTRITGYTPEEVRGKNPNMFQSGKHDAQFYQQMWQSILQDGHWQGEVWDLKKGGELHAKWLSISVIRHADGRIFRYVGQFSDITEKKRKDELIWEQANFDALTGLPNRRLFSDRFRQALSSSARSGRHGALLSLDLDQFKRLNDTFGHSMGDKLLIEVAHRLTASVREEDTVARMGGDEFLVILNNLSSESKRSCSTSRIDCRKDPQRTCASLISWKKPITTPVPASGSCYFSDIPTTTTDCWRMWIQPCTRRRPKAAMPSASSMPPCRTSWKNAARWKAHCAVRSHAMNFHCITNCRLQARDGLSVWKRFYAGRIHNSGTVSPAQFIPVAEESGLILPIGLWVLETACAQLARWQTVPQFSGLSIAVNVSAIQFRETEFVAQVSEVLRQSGIRPELLKLELTESLVLDNIEDSISKMKELKNLGVKFSMDDFGTGYSSLSYLSRLPIDQLKIDQSFVRDITTDQHDAAIVQTIISMALSMGMEVIAEGVETEEQREFLELRGCQAYQGYLFAKPQPIDELERDLDQMPVPG